MTTPTQRLTALGLTLPAVAAPVAAYVPATRTGGQVWTSGQLPFVDGVLSVVGTVGAEVTSEVAYAAARTAALNALAAVAAEAKGLDNVRRIVRVVAYVAAGPGFTGQPQVANGASDLILEVFGDAGRHVRSAVGVTSLPLGSPVEIEVVAEVEARPTVVPV